LLRKCAPFHSAWRPSGTAVSLHAFARTDTLYLRIHAHSIRFGTGPQCRGIPCA